MTAATMAPVAAADGRVRRLFGGTGIGVASDVRGGRLPAALADRYGGGELVVPLRADRPTVVANFVSTLDGVVALAGDGTTGGGEISGFFEPDRFVMGLLRGLADAVVVGAGTVRAAPRHRWVADHVQPKLGPEFAAWRRELALAEQPTTIVVTASGNLPTDHPGLVDPSIPVTVVTTRDGSARLAGLDLRPHIQIRVGREADRVTPAEVIEAAEAAGARLVLTEGGPHLFGDLLSADLVDELFLTVSPQLAGRSGETSRLGLIEGTAFPSATTRWGRLRSVHRSHHHLFLRYVVGDAGHDLTHEETAA